ncbi:thiamine-phosphate kinase [Oleisolibacter albus]|uniref:thiamine-phosphate kinase n=1 Tax=Oleisolibacter albus TaxID=2171757 RepID=UPI000DF17E06|nr:thiamine-phosphate kinase [Oleisolibacter albus]
MTAATPSPGSSAVQAALGEFGRIERYLRPLAADFPGAFDLTDDAALVDVPAGQQLVVTTDAMVAGVHFLASDPPEHIALKLLAVNLSDLAAKGASPLGYSLVTALPKGTGEDWLARFAAGLADGQRRWGIHLLGGDSVSTQGPVALTLSALGLVPQGSMVRRAGARPGDRVVVSGSIGDAALGLRLVLGQLDAPHERSVYEMLVDRLRRPEPRLALAPALRMSASAAVDVSDGLVADLAHLARASGVRVIIEAARVPVSDAAATLLAQVPDLMATMLTGGDDYELAFTVAPARMEALRQAAAAAGVEVTEVGRVEAGSGVQVQDRDGTVLDLAAGGWQHF